MAVATPDTPEKLVADFFESRWDCEPDRRIQALCVGSPQNALALLTQALEDDCEDATYLGDATSFVVGNELEKLAQLAYSRINAAGLAHTVIEHISLQAPAALRPLLADNDQLHGLTQGRCWHGAPRAEHNQLLAALPSPATWDGFESESILHSGCWEAVSILAGRVADLAPTSGHRICPRLIRRQFFGTTLKRRRSRFHLYVARSELV